MVVLLNGEYTYEYECCKELLLVLGDRIDLLIYISHLLSDHEMPGPKLMTLKYWVNLYLRSGHFPARPFVCVARYRTSAKRLEETSSILEGGLNECGVRHDRDCSKPGEGAGWVWQLEIERERRLVCLGSVFIESLGRLRLISFLNPRSAGPGLKRIRGFDETTLLFYQRSVFVEDAAGVPTPCGRG